MLAQCEVCKETNIYLNYKNNFATRNNTKMQNGLAQNLLWGTQTVWAD